MKEHAKKALKHDTKVLGKTVPTMLIIGLFLVGGGSAALLSSFGTVSGEADVDQAVELQSTSAFSFDSSQTAGETIIETRTIESNANVTTEIGLETTCSNSSSYSNTDTGDYVDWTSTSGCTGIDTKYVEYFDSAGHDFSDYSSPTEDSADGAGDDIVTVDDDADSDFDSISSAIGDSNVDSGDTIIVAPGDYDSFTVDKDVTVVSEVAPDATETASVNGSNSNDGTATGTAIVVSADGATVKGFEVVEAIDSGTDSRGIDVYAKNVKIAYNSIHDVKSEEHAIGIFLYGKDSVDNDVSNAEVSNNKIYDVVAYDPGQNSRSAGVTLTGTGSGDADNAEIKHNSIYKIGNSSSVLSQGIEVNGGYPQNFDISYNNISDVEIKDSASNYPMSVYVTGYDEGTDYGSSHGINYNNLLNTEVHGGLEVGILDNPDVNSKLNSSFNYWGTDGSVTDQTSSLDSAVKASFKNKTDTSIEAGTTDEFGVVNEFAINLAPETYDLTTSITPAGAEETPS